MSINLTQSEEGLRILDIDAMLTDKKVLPTEGRAFDGWVHVEYEEGDLRKEFARDTVRIALGTKSCLAQLGIFLAIQHRGKTKEPHIELSKHRLRAKVRGSRYSAYPVEVQDGDPVGRFFHKVGQPLSAYEVRQVMSDTVERGKPLYKKTKGAIGEDGGIILTARNHEYVVNPETSIPRPYRVQSRRDLEPLQVPHKLDESHSITQGEFIVTDTPWINMPAGLAGVLLVDQIGDMAMPAHLNSPIVDPNYSGHLKLELYQPHPYPQQMKDIFVRMYLFKATVLPQKPPLFELMQRL